MKKAYEDYLQLKPYQFVSWLSQQFDIDTPYTFTTEDDINRGLEVLSVYAQNISFLEDMQSFCKLYCRELKRLGPATKSSYEDMVDRGAAIDNKISGLKVLYQALNKNITLISDQLKRPQEHTISNSSQNGQWKNTGYQNRKHCRVGG